MKISKVKEWLATESSSLGGGIMYAIERPEEIYLSKKSRANHWIWTKNLSEVRFFKVKEVAHMVIEKNIDFVSFQDAFVSEHYFL